MQVSFFQELCGNTFNYIKFAYEAKKRGESDVEKGQLEEAYADFLEAARQETAQESANNIRTIALQSGQNDGTLLTYLSEKTVAMYVRMQRGELPQLPPLNGEGGMYSFQVPPIKLI